MVNTVMDFITSYDKEVGEAIQAECGRQRRNLELIASENIVSEPVMMAMGTVLTNKYAEGYPGKRYYGGCQYVDVLETIAIERAKKLFGCDYANVQPHSGAQANMAVFIAMLKPGDTVMGMNLDHGGHLTHGSPVNFSGLYFNIVPYGVDDEGFIDYDELERKAKEAEEAAEKERNITFSELWDNIYEPIYLSKKIQKTQVNEKSLYKKYIFPKIGALKIYEITPADIERLKDYLFSPALRANGEEKCLAPATVNHILDVIRQVFNSGINAGKFLNTNPASKVKRIKKDNRRIRFLSKEEIQELLDTLALMTNSPLHDICLLSLDTGLRANEIFSLEWMDVNFETKTLSIRDPKGIINRYANMTNKVYEMLVQRKNTVAVSSYVFTNTKGEKIKEISNQFDRVVAKLGFNDNITDTRNKVVFHTLRHTFASRLAMGGVDVYSIKELMGHSDIKMTMRYMHLAPKKFQEAISVIEAD